MSLPFFLSLVLLSFQWQRLSFRYTPPALTCLHLRLASGLTSFDSCYWGLFKKLLNFTSRWDVLFNFYSSIEPRMWIPFLSVNQAVWNHHGCLKSSWLPHLFFIQFCQFEIKSYLSDISIPPICFRDQRPETYPKDIYPQRLIPD